MLAAQQHSGGSAFLPAQQQQQQQHESSQPQQPSQLPSAHQQPQSKQDEDLPSIAASMWQVDEYSSFLRGLNNGLDNGQEPYVLPGSGGPDEIPDSSFDFDATKMSSIPGSHTSSYFSGGSDNGASPSSFHDFVYGVHNFPTPLDGDLANGSYLGARSASISMLSGLSPSSIDADSVLDAPVYASSSASIDASIPAPLEFLQTAAADSTGTSHFPATNTAWDPHFLAPSATATLRSVNPPPVIVSAAADPASTSAATKQHPLATSTAAPGQVKPTTDAAARKRTAAEMGSSNSTIKKAAKAGAKANVAAASGRGTKKLKGDPDIAQKTVPAAAAAAEQVSTRPLSKLPHMEVGSNATALAAIERLKAKRLKEAEEAAEAQRLKELGQQQDGHLSTSSSPLTGSRSDNGDKPELTPQMRQQKKVAHNAIERRYRNNINDRIAALRNAVPALCELRPRKTASGRKSRKAQQEEDLVDGVPAATKLNKATILGKATDYIKYLKGREMRLASEVTGLRELVRSLEGGEELLGLWESEMDKVVAEQEAVAAAAAAREEEDLSLQLDGDDGEADEDDDDDGDDDAISGVVSSRSSPSASSASRRQSRSGRGSNKLALAPSRYMLATFLGVSLLGGGAEFAIDSTAGDASVAVSRPSPGRVVIGANHQLLKRSTAYLTPPSMPQESHHFDNIPTHTLLFEVIRNVSLAFCFVLLVWPLVARFAPIWTTASACTRQRQSRRAAENTAKRRKEMLSSLSKAHVAPQDVDSALRKFVDAPTSTFAATLANVREAASLIVHTYFAKQRRQAPLDTERLAVWARLLEVETSLEKLAQPSSLLRLHTLLKVFNFCRTLAPVRLLPSDAILSPARVHGTLAIALAKLGDGIELAQDAADRQWELAKAAIAAAAEGDEEDDAVSGVASANELDSASTSSNDSDAASDSDSDSTRTISSDEEQPKAAAASMSASFGNGSWVAAVLKLDLDEALHLLSPPLAVSVSLDNSATVSVETNKYRLSPLIAIADSLYTRELGGIWATLLSSLVKGTCPASADLPLSSHSDGQMNSDGSDLFDASPLSCLASVREFCSHQASSHLALDVVNDAGSMGQMNTRIAKLAATAPKGTASWELSRITLATWALMLGNVGLAKGVAALVSSGAVGAAESAASFALRRLVPLDAGDARQGAATVAPPPHDAIDALASSVLGWLHFLRLFSTLRQTHRHILLFPIWTASTGLTYLGTMETQRTSLVSHSLELRRTLHAARLAGGESDGGWSTKDRMQLEEDLDELVDILSAVGRKAAAGRVVKGAATGKERDSIVKAFRWLDIAVAHAEDSGVEL